MNLRLILLFFLCCVSSVYADAWDDLRQAAHTAYTANFTGEYVRQTKNSIDTFDIYRQRDKQNLMERRVATNGKPYEIIRNRHQIAFYAANMAGLKRANANESNRFPAILPWHISQLSESYEATSHGAGRVAGRNCHIVRLTPYDGNRYTQELCLDDTDNLPLSRTYIHHNSVVRADLFSAIDREHTPQAQELLPSNALTYKVVRKFDERFAWAAQDDDFINSVLSGYTITGKERTPYGYYYLFTDGLTHIVLFIDPADEHSDAVSIVPTDGVLSSASIKVDTYRLTAVGDLPPNGLNQWLNSVSLNHQ